jgi:cobalt-zinc-cadmium efflux system outer membrane protein
VDGTVAGNARFRNLLIAAVLAVPVSAQLRSEAPELLRLSRRDAIERALANNPALAAARAQVEESRASNVVATALPDPTFAADIAGQSKVLNPGSRNASDQGVGVTFPFPGKTRLRREVASADLKAAELNLEQLQEQVAMQTAQAYDALLVALRHGEDLAQNKAFADEFLQKTDARFKAGTVARVDVV